ncbi:hypothetical protein EJ06DRAFT_527244 [Trichodelitschia bisporula]|uniref:Uncharacterized protein n=1 Tax=Trichodelitschia bisporula TaxID=703511 RepID=A0A6G1I5R3_9PEZI|nr:hypothetical protein EJ06DRAFT_527244 [Trichodelitschia bisporula]
MLSAQRSLGGGAVRRASAALYSALRILVAFVPPVSEISDSSDSLKSAPTPSVCATSLIGCRYPDVGSTPLSCKLHFGLLLLGLALGRTKNRMVAVD